jgi:L-ascorbate metabolism protein UlaG (beta-lactamase superfamily)
VKATSVPAKLVFVGHATVAVAVAVDLNGTSFLTEDLDAVLISHLHRDHADLPSLRQLGQGQQEDVHATTQSTYEDEELFNVGRAG